MKLMPFDCETGGVDPKKSDLLTAYFCITDENLNVIDELDLKLKPDSGDVRAEADALKVNGIILEEHLADPETITYSEGSKKLKEFLKKHSPKKRGIRPAGHNIAFDIGFVTEHLISKEEWDSFCHYRVLDTTPICTFLQDIAVWPARVGSLTSIVEYLGLPMLKAHTAKDDVLMWVSAYKKIKEQFISIAKGGGSVDTLDEISLLEL